MRSRSRQIVLAGLALVFVTIIVLVLVVTDPFAAPKQPSGVADNAAPTSLATVTLRSLSSQTPVNGTLGYADASSVRIPAGIPPSAVQQAEESVAASAAMLRTARSSLATDAETFAGEQATLSAARAKESVDCAGAGAAETASAGSSPGGEDASSSGLCTGDVAVVSSDTQGVGGAATKLDGDRTSLAAAEASLARAQAAASAARASEASYGQSSTFTALPAVGQVISRGQTLYAISGRPVLLRYGSPATRVLPLGSVAFEPGPVRVTSVTPALGANVTPGEVDVAPSEPRAMVDLDEAPVTVSITTASVSNALVVPVDALLALAGGGAAGAGGGYAVEVAEGRRHRLLAVSLGLFDDAEGLVQVSGAGLSAGQRVVVPAT